MLTLIFGIRASEPPWAWRTTEKAGLIGLTEKALSFCVLVLEIKEQALVERQLKYCQFMSWLSNKQITDLHLTDKTLSLCVLILEIKEQALVERQPENTVILCPGPQITRFVAFTDQIRKGAIWCPCLRNTSASLVERQLKHCQFMSWPSNKQILDFQLTDKTRALSFFVPLLVIKEEALAKRQLKACQFMSCLSNYQIFAIFTKVFELVCRCRIQKLDKKRHIICHNFANGTIIINSLF